MAQPSWAPKRKAGESHDDYKKRYYTAQRKNAEDTKDYATLDSINKKRNAAYKDKTGDAIRGGLRAAEGAINSAGKEAGDLMIGIEGGRALGGVGKALSGLGKGAKVASTGTKALDSASGTKALTGSASKAADNIERSTMKRATPVRKSLESGRVKGTSVRRSSPKAIESKKSLPSGSQKALPKGSGEKASSLSSRPSLSAARTRGNENTAKVNRTKASGSPKALNKPKEEVKAKSTTRKEPAVKKTPAKKAAPRKKAA